MGVFDCDGKDVGSEVEGEFETVGALVKEIII